MTDTRDIPEVHPRPIPVHSLDTMRSLPLREAKVMSGVDMFDNTYDTHIWALVTSIFKESEEDFSAIHTRFVSIPLPEAEWVAHELATTVGSTEFVEHMRWEVDDSHREAWSRIRPGTELVYVKVDILMNQIIVPKTQPTGIHNAEKAGHDTLLPTASENSNQE